MVSLDWNNTADSLPYPRWFRYPNGLVFPSVYDVLEIRRICLFGHLYLAGNNVTGNDPVCYVYGKIRRNPSGRYDFAGDYDLYRYSMYLYFHLAQYSFGFGTDFHRGRRHRHCRCDSVLLAGFFGQFLEDVYRIYHFDDWATFGIPPLLCWNCYDRRRLWARMLSHLSATDRTAELSRFFP